MRWALNLIGAMFVALIAVACWTMFSKPQPVDFVSFWTTSRMLLTGQADAVYDVAAHNKEQAVIGGDIIGFAYPPPFLLLIIPLGLLPYAAAFAAWVLGSGLLYFLSCRRSSLAHPCIIPNGFVGQTGFLTAAIVLGGCRYLRERPFLAGAILGLMVIKPHLGLLIPIALIAGRHWRAIGAAALSSGLLLVGVLMALGLGAYSDFFHVVPQYAAWSSAGRWPWHQIASPFAFFRFLGVPTISALAMHATIAIGATLSVWWAWRRDHAEKIPVLAAATVLISPYLFGYDCLLLAAPFLSLVRRGSYLAVVVWLLAALPVAASFDFYTGPNTLPIAAIVSLASLLGSRPLRTIIVENKPPPSET